MTEQEAWQRLRAAESRISELAANLEANHLAVGEEVARLEDSGIAQALHFTTTRELLTPRHGNTSVIPVRWFRTSWWSTHSGEATSEGVGFGVDVSRGPGSLMKIRIHAPKLKLPKTLPALAERRLSFELGRFAERIDHVILRFSETSGEPDGVLKGARNNGLAKRRRRELAHRRRDGRAVEKKCEIVVSLHSRKVRIEDTDTDLVAAFDRAVRRASRSVARAIERENWWQEGPANHPAARFRIVTPLRVVTPLRAVKSLRAMKPLRLVKPSSVRPRSSPER